MNLYKCFTCKSEIRYLTPKKKGFEAKCTNCWEIERRINDYLKSKKGRDFIRSKFTEALKKCQSKKISK